MLIIGELLKQVKNQKCQVNIAKVAFVRGEYFVGSKVGFGSDLRVPLPSSMITLMFFCSFYLKADLYISEVCVLRNIEKIETVASAYSIFCEKFFCISWWKKLC